MLTFDFLDARHGDCFLVRWDADHDGPAPPGAPGPDHERVMLVDGGPAGVYRASLQGRLHRLTGGHGGPAPDPPPSDTPPHLDVVCLSHVDDDHAGGLVRLFRDMRQAQQDGEALPYEVDALWFNSVEELVDQRAPGLSASVHPLLERAAASGTAVTASYNQGRDIRNAAAALRLDGNAPFRGPLTEGAETTLHDLDVTVVAPDEGALAELAERWREAKRRGDPEVISAAYADDSVPNLSSIVLLLRHADGTALLTGDARGDHVLAGLRALDLLDDAERERFHAHNDTGHAIDPRSLVDLFEAQDPAAEAVAFEGERLTYGELNARVNRLAHALRGRGVGPESRVAVKLPRSVDLIVALWAVLKSGAAYVPVDTGYPADRIAYLVADSRATLVLDEDNVRALGQGQPDTNPGVVLRGDHAAYVIHTSGTTGRPKGTVVTHAGIGNMLAWMQDEYRLTRADRVVHKTPVGFDVSVWEVFWTLTRGATLVVARPDGHRDPAYLARLVHDEQITVIHFVPAMLGPFLDEYEYEDAPSATLRMVSCGGEALSAGLADRFHRVCGARLHNSYGPTEFSVTATSHACVPGETVTIGTPTHNSRAYVLDPALRPVPDGVTGELYLAGVQLARGYLDRPGATAERFVADPHGPAGTRMYRTGDLVRRRADGGLDFVGRADDQIKINGQRVEPAEVEAVLATVPGVEQAVVLVHDSATGARQLVGYATGTPESDPRAYLARRLPAPMVPVTVFVLPSIPVTPNGKIDRRALPAPARQVGGRAPSTDTERTLHTLAAALLGRPELGVDDDLFALGADSIHAIQLVSRARRQGLHLTPQDVFDHPTVTRLAAVTTTAPAAPPVEDDPVGELPETPMARRLAERAGSTAGFAQSLLLATGPGLSYDRLAAALQQVLDRHDALRMRGRYIRPRIRR
ncbi:amino acid adenylation domain-containing protein, partial [Streptomyces stelliscabiei]|uniref:amino acid adenylation domain-containing protein n=1 Tax=Streptomyces stelliscabiei TaxID=146820 RepID=UPI000AD2E0AC